MITKVCADQIGLFRIIVISNFAQRQTGVTREEETQRLVDERLGPVVLPRVVRKNGERTGDVARGGVCASYQVNDATKRKYPHPVWIENHNNIKRHENLKMCIVVATVVLRGQNNKNQNNLKKCYLFSIWKYKENVHLLCKQQVPTWIKGEQLKMHRVCSLHLSSC